jgi:hypothetical protein
MGIGAGFFGPAPIKSAATCAKSSEIPVPSRALTLKNFAPIPSA